MHRLIDILSNARAALALSLINIAVYIVCAFYVSLPGHLILQPMLANIVAEPWRIFTYSTVHLSPIHIIVNTVGLFLLGAWLEHKSSAWMVFNIYFAGVAAGAFSLVVAGFAIGQQIGALIGSSAGIYAIAAGAIMLNRSIKIDMGFTSMRVNGNVAVGILAAVLLTGLLTTNPFGALAHLCGLFAGTIMAIRVKSKKENPNHLIAKAEQSGYVSLTPDERKSLFVSHNSRK